MKPINYQPIYVNDCAKLIKAIGAQIWLLEKFDYGFSLRCEKGTTQFRIIIPPITDNPATVPDEKGRFHIVQTLAGLGIWLEKVC